MRWESQTDGGGEMEKRTDKELSDYAAAQAAFYLKDYCSVNKGDDDLLECNNCIFNNERGCALADTGWDSFYPFQWRC